MPFWRFTALTLVGCIPWVLMLGIVGREVGENWEEWRDHLHYLDYAVVVAVAVAIAYLLIRRRGGPKAGESSPDSPAPNAEAAGSSGA